MSAGPTPDPLADALADLSAGNLKTGLDFLLEQAILAKDATWCYRFDLIQAAAAARGAEAREAGAKLKAHYGKEFSLPRFHSDIKEARIELERAAADTSGLPSGILRGSNGTILAGHENALLYFQAEPTWKGVLGFNEFTGGVEIVKKAPNPITQQPGEEIEDTFDTDATRWLERRAEMLFRPEIVHRVIDILARQNRFHPVRDYLNALPAWDRVPRISDWLFLYCGVDSGSDMSPNHYAASVGRKFLISLIARVMRPGCKADHMLVLEGKTGIGKSSIARHLVPNEKWFTDECADMGSKDASMQVRGVWIVELGELDALSRSDEKAAKRFISQQQERFRMPYGRRITRFDRQCAFIGTTERSDWMRSETGRRFWPVLCGKMDLDGLIRDRDLLWAEALEAYRAGERWHIQGADEIEEATSEQRQRYAEDVLRDKVLGAAEALLMYESYITIPQILDKLNIPTSNQDDRLHKRIGAILRFEGWDRKKKRLIIGANPSSIYYKPDLLSN